MHCTIVIHLFLIIIGVFIQGNKITFNMEATIEIYCPFRFDEYPFDKQHCPFQVGSYIYNASYLTFRVAKFIDMIEYSTSVLDYGTIEKMDLRDEYKVFSWSMYNNYSLAGYEMHMRRKSKRYIFNFYLPSSLFVIVSWVCN